MEARQIFCMFILIGVMVSFAACDDETAQAKANDAPDKAETSPDTSVPRDTTSQDTTGDTSGTGNVEAAPAQASDTCPTCTGTAEKVCNGYLPGSTAPCQSGWMYQKPEDSITWYDGQGDCASSSYATKCKCASMLPCNSPVADVNPLTHFEDCSACPQNVLDLPGYPTGSVCNGAPFIYTTDGGKNWFDLVDQPYTCFKGDDKIRTCKCPENWVDQNRFPMPAEGYQIMD